METIAVPEGKFCHIRGFLSDNEKCMHLRFYRCGIDNQLCERPNNYAKIQTNFDKVREFMEAFGQEVASTPCSVDAKTMELRLELIDEELCELKSVVFTKDKLNLVELADALADLLYVVYGMGHAYGIDLDACFAEVHNSNMTKLDKDGNPIYDKSGKVLKGPNYTPPQLAPILFSKKEI